MTSIFIIYYIMGGIIRIPCFLGNVPRSVAGLRWIFPFAIRLKSKPLLFESFVPLFRSLLLLLGNITGFGGWIMGGGGAAGGGGGGGGAGADGRGATGEGNRTACESLSE